MTFVRATSADSIVRPHVAGGIPSVVAALLIGFEKPFASATDYIGFDTFFRGTPMWLVKGMARALFSFKGRLARLEYTVGFGIFIACAGAVTACLGIVSDQLAWNEGDGRLITAEIISFLPLLWILFALLAKRMHDIGKTGLASLLVFVPLVGQLVPWVMLFYPGTRETNLYGAPRPGWFREPM